MYVLLYVQCATLRDRAIEVSNPPLQGLVGSPIIQYPKKEKKLEEEEENPVIFAHRLTSERGGP